MAVPDTLTVGRRQGRPSPHPLAILAVITVAVALLGVPGGLAWAAIAPRAAVVITGRGVAQVVNPETKAFIAADGWFCIIGVVGGLLAGLAGYLAAVRRHSPFATVGLILGGLAASFIEWWIGRNVGLASFHSALLLGHKGAVLHAPLALRAHGAVVIWPLTSALLVTLAELLAGQRSEEPAPAAPGSAQPP